MNKNSKILLIDNEERMTESLKTLLEMEGYSVKTFTDSEKASDFLKENSFDLVITDIKMPAVDGLEILNRAHQKDPLLEVILMTGYASLESAVEAVRLGAWDYVTKPCRAADLKRRIDEFFASAESRRRGPARQERQAHGGQKQGRY